MRSIRSDNHNPAKFYQKNIPVLAIKKITNLINGILAINKITNLINGISRLLQQSSNHSSKKEGAGDVGK